MLGIVEKTTYETALEIINKLPSNSIIQSGLINKTLNNNDSLPEMRDLLKRYSTRKTDNLDFLRAIHVTGSKGKGSVCAFSEKILRDQGLKTGMFTSPHLVHPRERIRINGGPINEELFAKHVLRLHSDLKSNGEIVSFFRFIWIVAIEIFFEEKIDVGIIEVGMGGRYDATNVIDAPTVCGITSIALEHTQILGPGIENIAFHKAGILKPGCPAFSVKQSYPEVSSVLASQTSSSSSSLLKFITTQDWTDNSWKLGIDGDHQWDNAALSCALASTWLKTWRPDLCPPSKVHFKSSLESVKWPGRHQIHPVSDKLILYLDGSHTVESISHAAKWFSHHQTICNCNSIMKNNNNNKKRTLLFFCTTDRDFKKLLSPLIEISDESFDGVVFTAPDSISVNNLETYCATMKAFWDSQSQVPARVLLNINDLSFDPMNQCNEVLVCGSLYLVGNVMKMYNIET